MIRYPHTLVNKQESIKDIVLTDYDVNSIEESETAVVLVGPKGRELGDYLRKQGFRGDLIQAIKLLPINEDKATMFIKYKKVFVYDSYGTKNGFAEAIGAALLDKGFKGEFKSFAIPNTYVQHATIAEQEKEFGLDIETVSKEIL